MAGTHIEITLDQQQAQANLAAMTRALENTTGLMHNIGERMLASTKARFSTQRAPDGTPWQALSPRYAKRKKYNADKILTLRGHLRGRGLAYQVDGQDVVRVGSNLIYSAIHQHGGTINRPPCTGSVRLRRLASGRWRFAKRNNRNAVVKPVSFRSFQINIPARPSLGLSDQDRSEIVDITMAWLNGQN